MPKLLFIWLEFGPRNFDSKYLLWYILLRDITNHIYKYIWHVNYVNDASLIVNFDSKYLLCIYKYMWHFNYVFDRKNSLR